MTDDDLQLMGAIIYYEAGNQTYEGKVAVGNVVVNRMLSSRFPDTLQGVLYQSGQFQPAGLCRSLVTRGGVPADCLQAAKDAIAGSKPVGNAVFFCRASVKGGTRLGAHCFYGTL